MVKSAKKVVKRKVPTFKRPNYGAKRRSRVKNVWRSQRGNDNHMRAKKKNVGVMPMIGFKNSDKVRFLRQDGTVEFVVHNRDELEGLAGKEGITAKFAHDLSKRSRMELQKFADEKKIRISNSFKAEVKPKAAGTEAKQKQHSVTDAKPKVAGTETKQKSAETGSDPKPGNQKSNDLKG